MNSGAAAPAPAPPLSHGEDMRNRMTYHGMNNCAAPSWNAAPFQAAPVTNSADAFPLYGRADVFQATPLNSGTGPFPPYAPADLRALQAGSVQVPNMYGVVQAPNMYNVGGQVPNTYNRFATYQAPTLNNGAVGGQVPNMCNGAATFPTPATSTKSDRPNGQNPKTGSKAPQAPIAHEDANTAEVPRVENGVKGSQAPAMSTSADIPVPFGTSLFDDFSFGEGYSTYWTH